MKRWLVIVCMVAVAACQERPEPTATVEAPGVALQAAVVDPALEDALVGATEDDTLNVIVNYDEMQTTLSSLTNAVLDLGAGVIQFENLSMLAARATPLQVEAIAALAGVQSVYLNAEVQYLLAEGLATIRADEVHDLGVTGAGVGVAILDSGIDGYHPDLLYPSKTVANVKYLASWEREYKFKGNTEKPLRRALDLYIDDVPNSETSIGHGTHVAGIAAGDGAAAGKYTGVAPGAKLIGIGSGDVLFIFWILAGFDYILEHQADYNIKVVNNSWGSSGEFDPDHPINEATKEVQEAGVTVVFAAGNCGTGGLGDPAGVDCPAPDQTQLNPYSVAPWAISVAAGCKLVEDPTNSASHCEDPTGQDRDKVLADFSSRGLDGRGELYEPDITAPGVHIVSTRASTGTVMNGLDANHDLRICNISTEDEAYYTCASGTSMASPHLAGVVALMQEAAGGTLSPDEILQVLKSTARPLEGYRPFEVGAGYVDALAAVKAVMK